MTLATLGYYRQLLATLQHIDCGAGDTGNTGLQQATAGNSATHRMWCWRPRQHWARLQPATAGNSATHRMWCWRPRQHWVTTGNCWQLSNTQDVVLETQATMGYNRQLLATQQHIGCGARDPGSTGLQQATAGNSAAHRMWCWRPWQH